MKPEQLEQLISTKQGRQALQDTYHFVSHYIEANTHKGVYEGTTHFLDLKNKYEEIIRAYNPNVSFDTE